MARIHLKYECRHPEQFPVQRAEQYRIALEQMRWADGESMIETITFCEHHGSEDGYLPSPTALACAAAAVTEQARLRVNCVLPFHDPIRVAEDLAVLDIISNGRAEIAVLAGYVPSEFELFGRELKDRGALIEEGIELIKQAWMGDSFQWQGRQMRVTPVPIQEPRPPIFIGGNVGPAARRAARIADGFIPMLPESFAAYEAECEKLGKPAVNEGKVCSLFLHVSDDPDRDWQKIAPHALYETNCYARWQAQTGVGGHFQEATCGDTLRQSGVFLVLSPEQTLELIANSDDDAQLLLHPLMGGMDPELGWQSLRLFREQVYPYIHTTD